MNFNHAAITIRPRNPWEAADLGCVLARQWLPLLWRLWLSTGLPVALAILLVPGLTISWRLLLFWWFKPMFEPLLLFWLSRAVFGENLSAVNVLKKWRAIIVPGLVHSLTWRRFSPERSFLLPVLVLEGAKGERRTARVKILSKDQTAAPWLTVVCFVIETMLTISALALIALFIPRELRQGDLFGFVFSSPRLPLFLYVLAISFVTPMYVAGGFMLYISRRVDLEAWDIEIGFKNIVRRATERKKPNPGSAVGIILLAGTFFLTAHEVRAADIPPPQQCRQVVEQVLDGKDFGKKQTVYRWERIENNEEKVTGLTAWLREFFRTFFKGLGDVIQATAEAFKKWTGSLASICEVILWVAVGGGAGWILYRYTGIRHWFSGSARFATSAKQPARVLFGMRVTPESLPDDIVSECRKLLKQGEIRRALALLYRGTLSSLVHDHELHVPASATEMECNRLVQQYRSAPEAGFFNRLTLTWLCTAYGHSSPEQEVVRELTGQWSQLYGTSHDK